MAGPSGATARLALPYPIPGDTADVPRDVKALADGLDGIGSLGPAVVTDFPTSPAPVEGQQVLVGKNHSLWNFYYASAWGDAYKWMMIGGVADLAAIVGSAVRGAANAYGDLTGSPGPTLTLPFAGLWIIEAEANVQTIGGAAGNEYLLGVSVNGGAPVGANGLTAVYSNLGAGEYGNLHLKTMATFAKNDVLKLVYYSQVSTTSAFEQRRLWATPVRVG